MNILCYSLILEWPQGSLRYSEWSLRSLQNEWITQMFTDCLQIHSNFTRFWNSLLKEWTYSVFWVNLEWTFVLFTDFGVTTRITQGFRVIPEVTPKWVNNTNVHSKFTLISLSSEIHSLKSEHIHSFLFREYM